ncbi:MAG: hypothetical protein AABX29_05595 [Nanoarchaeota archaeon]
MKGILQILIGIIIIIALVWLTFFGNMVGWGSVSSYIWSSVLTALVGGLAWLLLLIGIALVVVGFSELKE